MTITTTNEDARTRVRDERWRSNLLVSVAAGIVVALIVGIVGVAYAKSRPVKYEATSSIVLLPARSLDETGTISALDALSRGQVVDTFAHVLAGEGLVGPAVQEVAADGRDASGVTVSFKPVSDTSVIDIVVTSPSAFVSEHVAGAIATASTGVQASLQPLFQARVVSRGAGTATRTGAKTSSLILAFLITALAAGILTQQLVWRVLSSGRVSLPRSRRSQTERAPADTPPAAAARADARPDARPDGTPGGVRVAPNAERRPTPAPTGRNDDGAEPARSPAPTAAKPAPAPAKQKPGAPQARDAQHPRPPRPKTVEPSPKKP